jgi:hypothetical protein
MAAILIWVFLFIALAIASILWGVDSTGLDTRTRPEPSLQTPQIMDDRRSSRPRVRTFERTGEAPAGWRGLRGS